RPSPHSRSQSPPHSRAARSLRGKTCDLGNGQFRRSQAHLAPVPRFAKSRAEIFAACVTVEGACDLIGPSERIVLFILHPAPWAAERFNIYYWLEELEVSGNLSSIDLCALGLLGCGLGRIARLFGAL